MFVIPRFILMLSLLMLVSACETVDGWIDGKDHVTVNNVGANDVKVEPVSLTPPSAQGASISDADLRGMTRKLSGGSVEIYDIESTDSGMISIAPVESMQTPAGMAYPSDPSVTVYPLDDSFGGGYPAPAQSGAMTPAPFTTEPLGAPSSGGKASPRVGKDVSQIYFGYGSDRIGSGDQSVLRQAAETAKFAPVDRVRVEGHASVDAGTSDPVRAKVLNLKESMNRAYAVSRTLIKEGVPAEKIKTVAWGDTVPAGSEEQQRRVDIIAAPGQ